MSEGCGWRIVRFLHDEFVYRWLIDGLGARSTDMATPHVRVAPNRRLPDRRVPRKDTTQATSEVRPRPSSNAHERPRQSHVMMPSFSLRSSVPHRRIAPLTVLFLFFLTLLLFVEQRNDRSVRDS